MNITNKWAVALGAILVHLSIGSVYAYSIMITPVSTTFSFTASELKVAFSMAVAILGVFSAIMTPILSKKNPTKVLFISAVLYSAGIALSGYGISIESLPLFYLGYGVLGGLGLGFGYALPIYTLVKWFPNNKGFATGLGVMGFGFASLIFGPIMAKLFIADSGAYTTTSITTAFYKLSIVYFVLISIGSLLVKSPVESDTAKPETSSTSAKEMMLSAPYIIFWFLFLLNTLCGITLISTAAPMMESLFSLSALQAAGIVGMMGLFNGVGRFFWSFVSDYIGRVNVLIVFGVLQFFAFMLMFTTTNVIVFQACLFLVMSFYGAGFSIAPAYISDTFGTSKMASLYGVVLICWSIAAIFGPIGVSYLQTNLLSGDYLPVLKGFAVVFVVFSIMTLVLKLRLRKK